MSESSAMRPCCYGAWIITILFILSTSLNISRASTINTLERMLKGKAGAQLNTTKLWAVLVAGSPRWENYRYQAGVCHAYQTLHSHGVPDERIVVLMFDDIAYSANNPTPGVILNHPDGPNVYPGVPKDYTSSMVSTETFFNVLRGQKPTYGSGKVVASGPDDHVFVYFIGDGEKYLIQFPDEAIYAHDLSAFLVELKAQRRFSKMVFYLDTCSSGSMFEFLLPGDSDVYALTATDSDGVSGACYFDADRLTTLGSRFSVSWMEDTDRGHLARRTLLDQYNVVKRLTRGGASRYGDLEFQNATLSEFQGPGLAAYEDGSKAALDPVDIRDVPLFVLLKKLEKAVDPDAKRSLTLEIKSLVEKRDFLERRVFEIANLTAGGNRGAADFLLRENVRLTKYECYKQLLRHFDFKCFRLSENPYALRHLQLFANLCEMGFSFDKTIRAIDTACTNKNVSGVR